MIRKTHLTICLLAAFLLFGSSAHAGLINLPPAMYRMGTSDYWVGNGSPNFSVPLTEDKEYTENRIVPWPSSSKIGTGTATVSAKLGPAPSVSSYLSSKNGFVGYGTPSYTNGYEHFDGYKVPSRAWSELEYYFHIQGPQNVRVPIVVDYKLKVMSSGSVYDSSHSINAGTAASAWMSVGASMGDNLTISYGDEAKFIEKDGSLSLNIMANLFSTGHFIRLVTEIATHNYAGYYDGLMEGYAFADPVIRIDPSFADANLYTVVLSDGVGNSWTAPPAPTPEPGTALLMGVGLLVVGAVARRKRLHA